MGLRKELRRVYYHRLRTVKCVMLGLVLTAYMTPFSVLGDAVSADAIGTVSSQIAGCSGVKVSMQVQPSARSIPASRPQSAQLQTQRVTRTEEALLLKRGETYLGMSDVVAARLVFRDLAKRGSSRAAFLLAKTYDPRYAALYKLTDGMANAETAAEYYRWANELEAKEYSQAQLPPISK